MRTIPYKDVILKHMLSYTEYCFDTCKVAQVVYDFLGEGWAQPDTFNAAAHDLREGVDHAKVIAASIKFI